MKLVLETSSNPPVQLVVGSRSANERHTSILMPTGLWIGMKMLWSPGGPSWANYHRLRTWSVVMHSFVLRHTNPVMFRILFTTATTSRTTKLNNLPLLPTRLQQIVVGKSNNLTTWLHVRTLGFVILTLTLLLKVCCLPRCDSGVVLSCHRDLTRFVSCQILTDVIRQCLWEQEGCLQGSPKHLLYESFPYHSKQERTSSDTMAS